uniref:Ig-like domain-containing protein n=1 Tax=Gopherus agassizii TaxID=38772 RepID=A0A452HJ74_9SAUR
MAWAPLLLTLLTYCSGTRSQYVVTQEPSLLVSPGGTVKLSCRMSIVSDITSIYPYWIQQRGGRVPRLLIYDANVKVSGTPERFSGSSSGNTAYLTISGALAEDDADYYCLTHYYQGGAFKLHREEEQKPLSPIVTQHLEPTCVSLVPMRWPSGLNNPQYSLKHSFYKAILPEQPYDNTPV